MLAFKKKNPSKQPVSVQVTVWLTINTPETLAVCFNDLWQLNFLEHKRLLRALTLHQHGPTEGAFTDDPQR